MRSTSRKQRIDQADVVVSVSVPKGDVEEEEIRDLSRRVSIEVAKAIEQVNATRKGRLKLRSPIEITVLDAGGNVQCVFPKSGAPSAGFEKKVDTSNLPIWAVAVAADERENRIVVRIEYERHALQ
jgi:hypothetical protein